MQRKGPLPGKIFARCIPKRLFAGLFGCMARISCQSQLISDAWRANLAANWRFSRPRPLSGCMERKTCHGLMPGNAPRRNLATARPLGTHRARILPLPVGPRAHQGAIPPPPDAGGRTARAFCHRRAPGNAPWRNLVTTSRPRTHFAKILPWTNAWIRPAPNNCRPPRKKKRHRRQDLENAPARSTKDRVLARLGRAAGTARCSAIAEHSGMQRGEISQWPITRPETKEGERFARLLLLFCLRLEWPSGTSR